MRLSKPASFAAAGLVLASLSLRGSYLITPPPAIFPSTGTPAVVQATGGASGSATSFAVSFATPPKVANVVIAAVISIVATDASLSAKVSDNANGTYGRFGIQTTVTNPALTLWCAPVVKAVGTFTVTVTVETAFFNGLIIGEASGMSCNPDKFAGASSNASPYNCGSITTDNGHDLVLAAFGTSFGGGGTNTYTAPAGFTTWFSLTDGTKVPAATLAYQIRSTTGTFTPTQTTNVTPVNNSMCAVGALLSK